MPDFRFLLHRRALAAFSSLTASEKDALENAMAPFVDLPPQRWPARGAVRLETREPLFLVPVDESLRAVVQPSRGGQPEVLDLVREELLERYFQQTQGSAESP